MQINRVRLPATLLSLSLYRFFFFFSCLVSSFNTIFPFGLFFFILTADAAGHALGSIYTLSLSPEFISLEKGFQKLLICILAKLNGPDKNHKLSRHVSPLRLLKQLNFFQC